MGASFSVFRARAVYQTSAHERLLESLSEGTALDHEYVLYASQRSNGQRDAGSSMGKVDCIEMRIHVL